QGGQYLRGGVVHRRDRRARAPGPGGVPAPASHQRARRRGAAALRGQDGLAAAALTAAHRAHGEDPHRPRDRLRALQARGDHRGNGDGGRGGAGHRRGAGHARRLRPGLRAHDQSRVRAGAARGQHHPDPVAHAARGGHLRPAARDLGGLGLVSDPPLPRGPHARVRPDPAPRPAAAGRGRGGLDPGAGRARQRDLRRHRGAASHRALPARTSEGGPRRGLSIVRFGVFDHIEPVPGLSLDRIYRERLQQIERLDAAGFHAYHLAEHHTPAIHSLAPSQNVFLAAVAQRTRRLRFGPCVYVLPLHHPLRLIEEISMLDNLSGGRLEIGVGRGGVMEAYFWGQEADSETNYERYRETLAIVREGLSHDKLTYAGRFHSFEDLPMYLRPLQKPYPPLWYMRNPVTAAMEGMHTIIVGSLDGLAVAVPRYRAAWEEHQGSN